MAATVFTRSTSHTAVRWRVLQNGARRRPSVGAGHRRRPTATRVTLRPGGSKRQYSAVERLKSSRNDRFTTRNGRNADTQSTKRRVETHRALPTSTARVAPGVTRRLASYCPDLTSYRRTAEFCCHGTHSLRGDVMGCDAVGHDVQAVSVLEGHHRRSHHVAAQGRSEHTVP